MLFVAYPNCSTCKKAQAWLDAFGAAYTLRHIKTQPPTQEELAQWHEKSGLPLQKFFNTSGQLYRAMGLKDKLPHMTDAEKYALLASDGMLVKRPLLITGQQVLVGFQPDRWAEALNGEKKEKNQ